MTADTNKEIEKSCHHASGLTADAMTALARMQEQLRLMRFMLAAGEDCEYYVSSCVDILETCHSAQHALIDAMALVRMAQAAVEREQNSQP